MKTLIYIFPILFSIFILACKNKQKTTLNSKKNDELNTDTITKIDTSLNECFYDLKYFPGNTIKNPVLTIRFKRNVNIDPIDDTLNFKLIRDDIYSGRDNKIYIKSMGTRVCKNYGVFIEYYQDKTDLINPENYRLIEGGYFASENNVYLWHPNSDGTFAMSVEGADASSFESINGIWGGKDKNGVYYGSPPESINRLEIEHPKSAKFYAIQDQRDSKPFHYILDLKNVYYTSFDLKSYDYVSIKIKGIKSEGFKIIEGKGWDAEYNSYKYLKGKRIN